MAFLPPNQHAYNGLVGQHLGKISNHVTSMFACARWMPEALWPDTWQTAKLILNLYKNHLSDVDQSEYVGTIQTGITRNSTLRSTSTLSGV